MLKRPIIVLFAIIPLSFVLASCVTSELSGSDEDYPSRDITMHVPYAAGGATDITARAVAPYLEEELGQPVAVINTPGATGAVGSSEVISSEPDGHTIMMGTIGSGVLTPLVEDVGYTKDDYATIGNATQLPAVIAVSIDSPYNSAEELFEAARANPDEITVGTAGANSAQQIELEQLSEEQGIPLKPVPFDGGAEAAKELLGGNTTAAFIQEPEAMPNIVAGEFKPIGLGDDERSTFLPDVPTLKEQGYDLTSIAFYGLMAPKDTPSERIDKLEGLLQEALDDPEVVENLEAAYIVPEFLSSEDMRELVDERWNQYEAMLNG
jgi:tripartite-type tricarboxylate transporter receptor subunit TctC